MRRCDFHFGSSHWCTYCGDPVDNFQLDHVIPLAYTEGAYRITCTKGQLRKNHGPVTTCCSQCNSILGARFFNTFWDRCLVINSFMECRATPILWSEQQINELGGSLKTYIKTKKNHSLWYRNRADWFKCPEFFETIEGLLTSKFLDHTEPCFNEDCHNFFASTLVELHQYQQDLKERKRK